MAAIEDEIVEDNEAVPGVEQTNPETVKADSRLATIRRESFRRKLHRRKLH